MLTIQTDEFLEAVRKNDTDKILELLNTQPTLARTRDPNGVSGIFLALYRGNRGTAAIIAQRNSSLDVFEAAAIGDLARLKNLFNDDPALVKSYSPDGFTALALAAYLGEKDAVEFLIEKGADLNALAKNETGFTPLTGAVSQNHTQIARLLMDHGADVNHKYEGGFTPIMHAAHAGNVELVTLLIDHGADPNAKNGEGKTALSFAQEKNREKVVDLLRKHGAV